MLSRFRSPISDKALAYFYIQLATLEDAGITPAAALDSVKEQFRSTEFKSILLDIQNQLEKGRTLSEGMERHRRVFSPLQCSLMRAAETGGSRADTLRRLAAHLERRAKIREQLVTGLAYPVILLHLGVFVFGFVAYIFAKENSTGAALQSIFIVLGPLYAVVVLVILGQKLFGNQVGWDRALMRIPLMGGLLRRFALIRLTRTLAAHYESGVNLTEALELCAETTGRPSMKTAVLGAADLVEGGRPLADAFVATELFTPTLLQMMSVGEQAGKVPETLYKIAEILEDEAGHSLKITLAVTLKLVFLVVAGYLAMRIILFWATLPRE